MIVALRIVDLFFYIYSILLVLSILLSWFPEYEEKPPVRFLRTITNPYLLLFRRLIPPLGMLDLSPILAFFALRFIEGCIKWLLIHSSL